MAKKTKTPEEVEMAANRDRWDQMINRHIIKRMREWEEREASQQELAKLPAWRRRLFPWRVRIERLT